ncbi:MAG: protein kinase [Polyangiaceae bacterium]|nr:protein kinase [Polyangiaceae bacterium]
MELEADLVVGGRYRLERQLGQGGMGEVWAAQHAVTRRRLALKFLSGPVAPSAEARRRFLREARAASAVEHPNVVAIHDVFEVEDGTLLMVMDLLEGETLGQRLRRERELPLEVAARLLLPVVSAVGTAHERGIVHRDLKPDNIFIAREAGAERVKVLDFGIAKLFSAEPGRPGLTGAGAMLGTPCYMAPEQAGGEADIDHRADEWAIGVILYEALSGGRPIEGENVGQVLTRLLRDGIPPIRALVPDLPEDVARVIGRLLSKERADRPDDLREVAAVLAAHCDGGAPSFGAPGARPIEEVSAEPASRTVVARPRRWGRAWVWAAALVALVGVALAGSRWLARTAPEPAVPPAASSLAPLPQPASLGAAPPPSREAFPEAESPGPTASARVASRVRTAPGATPSSSAMVSPVVPGAPDAAVAPVRSAKPGGLVEDPPF